MSDAITTRARQEAAAWFARLSRRSVTTEALQEFRAWCGDPENAEAYSQVEATWDAAGALKDDPELRAATEAALQGGSETRPRAAAFRWGVGIGAVVATGVAAVIFFSGPTYRTAIGEQRLVVLPDGTRMRLNTDSRVRVRFRSGRREVELSRGEAFFEVAHDAARPFVLRSDGAMIRDIGTTFDVRRHSDSTQVTLLEGSVEVAGGGAAVTLAPNQQLVVNGKGVSRPVAADPAQATSWTTGRLTFRNMPLSEATAEVNRYARRRIVLDVPPDLAQRPVTGVFDAGDSKAFVAAVGTLFDLEARGGGGGDIRLSPKASAPEG
jgi:transmembrane sensor